MPTRVDEYWAQQLTSLKSNNRSWGGVRLWNALREEGGLNAPSQSWVSIWLRAVWPDVSEEQRQEYRLVYWPESFDRGDLPWEASESALELLAYLDHQNGGVGERPSVRSVRWFWRVSQARPNARIDGRVKLAEVLTIHDLSGTRVSPRGAEWLLAYRGWDGEAPMGRYKKALERTVNPIDPFWGSFIYFVEPLRYNDSQEITDSKFT